MALNMGRKRSSLEEYVIRASQSGPSQETSEVITMPGITLGTSSGTGCVSGFGCQGDPIHIPTPDPCGECGGFQRDIEILKDRVDSIEQLLGDKTNTVIAMTDSSNNEVSIVVLAEQEA